MRSSAGHIDQRGSIQGTHLPNDASPKGKRSGHLGLGHIVMASRKAPISQFKILFASFESIKYIYSISQVVFLALGSVLYVYISNMVIKEGQLYHVRMFIESALPILKRSFLSIQVLKTLRFCLPTTGFPNFAIIFRVKM
jgi:hypothetical protein